MEKKKYPNIKFYEKKLGYSDKPAIEITDKMLLIYISVLLIIMVLF